MNWITETTNGVILQLRIVTRASRSEVAEVVQDELKVRLQAPPVDGKANKELIRLLSRQLRVPAGNVAIISGQTGRHKRVAIAGLAADRVHALLNG